MQELEIDISKTALLVVDMQNDFLKATKGLFLEFAKLAQAEGIVSNFAKVIAAARQVGIPVVFTAHVHKKDKTDVHNPITDIATITETASDFWEPLRNIVVEGTHGADIVDELKPAPGEHVVYKRRCSAFYGTDLEIILRSRGIDTLIMGGIVTDGCFLCAFRGAWDRDFEIIVLGDCCATSPERNGPFFINEYFPRYARVRKSDEVVAAITQGKTSRMI